MRECRLVDPWNPEDPERFSMEEEKLSSGTGAPSCSLVFNPATEGLGPERSFLAGAQNGTWFINNNQGGIGRKQGFVVNLSGQSLGSTVPGQDHLIGVLVVPVIANPGAAQLTVTATPNGVLVDANVYTWGDSPLQISAFDLTAGPGTIEIFQPPPMQLRIGSLVVSPDDITSESCLQIPILGRDRSTSRELFDLTFTVEITGDTGILVGGVSANMLVGNAFASGDRTGLANPGVNLTNNSSGTSVPSCPLVFNRATSGQGSETDFAAGAQNATWFINNNQGGIGRKQGFVVNLAAQAIASTVAGQEMLLGVLVLPVAANPGPSRLTIAATPNSVVADANLFTWLLGGVLFSEELDLRTGRGVVDIVQPIFLDGFESGDMSSWSATTN